MTVKITGAGLPEFAGFAQEILERIYSGTEEVNRFAGHLDSLQKEVKVALSFGVNLSKSYSETVPAVASALRQDAQKIAGHRQNLGAIARDVGAIARGVQSKVASTLSALQIGDITRQRIEHETRRRDACGNRDSGKCRPGMGLPLQQSGRCRKGSRR